MLMSTSGTWGRQDDVSTGAWLLCLRWYFLTKRFLLRQIHLANTIFIKTIIRSWSAFCGGKVVSNSLSALFMSFPLSLSVLICLRFAHDDGTCTSSLACLALNPSSGDTKGAGYLAVGAESGESARYTKQQHTAPQCASNVDVTCCTSVDFNHCISCS